MVRVSNRDQKYGCGLRGGGGGLRKSLQKKGVDMNLEKIFVCACI